MTSLNFPEKHDSLDFVLEHHRQLHKQLDHEHMVIREAATECLLGSAFAGAPISKRDGEILPMWKKALHSVSSKPETIPEVALVSIYGPFSEDDFFEEFDALSGKERIEAIETRKKSYQKEYHRLNDLRNDLLAEVSMIDDPVVVGDLFKDIKQIETMLEKIEMRSSMIVGGVDGNTQKIARRRGSLYK